MTLGQVFTVLRARWLVFCSILAVTVGATLAVSMMLPKRYTASASVVVDPKPDPVSAMMYQGMASPAYMATQVDIIQSERVAYKVVKNLRLADAPQVRDQWRTATGGNNGTVETWLVDGFKKAMDVKPSRESNVITIAFTGQDPKFSAALANAFVQAYTETALELRVDPAKQYSSFFDNRVKEARDNLERAQAQLSKFQRDRGFTASDERLDVETARLNELSTQLVMLQALSAESSSRQVQAQGGGGDRLQEVLNNPVVGGLRSDLSRAEARLKELSSRYGDNHPQVIEAKANITEMRARIDTETRRVAGGVSVSNTINKQREAQVRADLEAQRDKVMKLKAAREDSAVLVRDVENAQRSYDAIQARLSQSSLESQTTQSNINVLTAAVAPTEPSAPKILLNVVLSVLVGLLLASATAVAMELMDRRVRTISDVSVGLDLPVIGVLPKSLPDGKSGASKFSAMQLRLVPRLSGPNQSA